MKTLLLLFCLFLAPLANAQPMCASVDCGSSCAGCHFPAQMCYPDSYNCYDCGPPCPPWEGGLLTRKPQPAVRDLLTDAGHAFLAAVVPTMFRNPTRSKLPPQHPTIPDSYWAKRQDRARKAAQQMEGCKVPVDAQVLAVSMLRGKL